MCFIGGGAGMAPMRSHIFDQLLRLATKRKITFWYGARSLREAFYVDEFDRLRARAPELRVAPGAVRAAARGRLDRAHRLHPQRAARPATWTTHPAPEDVEYYMCGPGVMNKAVIDMLLVAGRGAREHHARRLRLRRDHGEHKRSRNVVGHRRSDELISVPASATVADAVDVMVEREVGAVLVMTEDRLVAGIFSERDLLVRVVHAGRDPASTPLSLVMTRDVRFVSPGTTTEAALSLMHVLGFRHLLVIDGPRVLRPRVDARPGLPDDPARRGPVRGRGACRGGPTP